MTDKPVKFGTSTAQILVRMLWNEHYRSDHELIMDLAAVMNEELRDLAVSCPLIQIEEPRHHYAALRADTPESELQFFSDAFHREVKGVEAEIWVDTRGATRASSGCSGRSPRTSARSRTCWTSTPTSSPSSAPAPTGATSPCSASSERRKRSPSAS